MDRLTERVNGIVYYRKDGVLMAAVNMSSFDVRNALKRLAELEDQAEQREQGCDSFESKGYAAALIANGIMTDTFMNCPFCGCLISNPNMLGKCHICGAKLGAGSKAW